MTDDLENAVTQVIVAAFQKYQAENEIAAYIKKQLDSNFGESWHCIVGVSFGSFVSHTHGFYLYADVDDKSVLVFKTE